MGEIDWKYVIFGTFLVSAAWQDLRHKSVSIWLYIGYGAVAAWISSDYYGVIVGVLLLAAGKLTGGSIGTGDGFFFVISGLYLSLFDNVRLLLNGILLGGVFCLFLFLYGKMCGRSMRGATVPFLPFLVPAWIGMVIF